jgi:succinate dehydrogenase/fumarate reductase flavoprotein subunit
MIRKDAQMMMENVGVYRTAELLQGAIDKLAELKDRFTPHLHHG